MINLKRFPTAPEYDEFKVTSYPLPNVSLVVEGYDVYYAMDNGMSDYYTKADIDNKLTAVRNTDSNNNSTSVANISSLSSTVQTLKSRTIPTKLSQLSNNAGYLKNADISQYITGVTETDPTVSAWAKASSKPTYNASEVGALPPGTTLDNVGDGSSRKLSTLMPKDGSKVLVTNDYTTTEKNKLAGIAASAQVNTIETIRVNTVTLETVSNKTVNITVPTKISELTNNSNFITTANTKNFITSATVKTQVESYGYTNKTGTITGVTMNNASKGTSGVANLGTVVTSLKINTTNGSVSNGAASVTLTMPTGLPTVSASDNGKTLKVVNGAWAASN